MTSADRREQLIDVSRSLFAERGFDGTSVEEIAATALVSKPVVYEHFGGKEGLYAVVVDREVRTLLDGIRGSLTSGHQRELLEQAALALLDYIEAHTDGFRILARDSSSATPAGRSPRSSTTSPPRWRASSRRSSSARGSSPRHAPIYAQMLVGMVAITGQWWLDAQHPGKREVAAHLVNLSWNGLSHLQAKPTLVTDPVADPPPDPPGLLPPSPGPYRRRCSLNRYRRRMRCGHDDLPRPCHRPAAPLGSPTASRAVALLFAVNGMLIGGNGGALPSLREKLQIDDSHVALMLFCGGLAGILSMQVGGRLADAVGARAVALCGLPVLIASAVTIALAPTFGVAVLGLVLLGLGNGAMDVGMNALGVQVEAARRRPVMSTFHAWFSIGGFAGAGAVLLLARVLGVEGGDVVTPLMLGLAAIAVVVLVVLVRITPQSAVVAHTVDGVRARIPRAAWVLGLMALAFGLSEGTAVDWSAIHVTDVARVDPTTGALGPDRRQRLHGRHPAAGRPAGGPVRPPRRRPLRRRLRRRRLRRGHPGGHAAAAGRRLVPGGLRRRDDRPAGLRRRRPPRRRTGAGRRRHLRLRGLPDGSGRDRLPRPAPRHPAHDGGARAALRRDHRAGGDHAADRHRPGRGARPRLSGRRGPPGPPGPARRMRAMAADREPRDEVDLVVEAWSRERPDLDVTPLRVLSRVTRLARHLDRQRAASFQAHGLETWEFDVLAALRRAGAPNQLSPGQLLRETMVTSGTMTNRVDRLAARGLVRRDLHPGDKRGVLVGLTDAGRTAVDAALADLLEAEQQLLAGLDEGDQHQLARTLRRLLVVYREDPTAAP